MNTAVWAHGRLWQAHAPVVSGLDHGFLLGDGIYETIAVREGEPFALTRHLGRLDYSLERIGLPVVPHDVVRGAVADVLRAGEGKFIRLRITVTSGAAPLGLSREPGAPTLVVAGTAGVTSRVCRLVRVPWQRNERSPLVGLKVTSALENVMMARYATSHGGDEALMANTLGHLCEGAASNVFVEKEGEILTPPLSAGCLPGITRSLLLEWGSKQGIPVRVASPGELEFSVLDDVLRLRSHVAVSSVTRGLQVATHLDGVEVVPGPITAELARIFEDEAQANRDPAPERVA